ncbi:MAG: hypothetical protein JSS29_14655 [Proteobacteria bacterium]|nr:hypothetical protein [Pseudomonadota bacterium]
MSSRIIRNALIGCGMAALAACTANGAGSSSASQTQISDPPIVTVAVAPATLEAGEAAVITWNSAEATSCKASGAWSGTEALTNQTGMSTGALGAGTYSYGLTCTGPGGTGSDVRSVTVGVAAAPAVTLVLQPTSIQPGATAVLTWTTTNAASCAGVGGSTGDGWSGAQPLNNTKGLQLGPFSANGSYTYTLNCTGAGGTGSSARILTVSAGAPPAPPTVSFSATPTSLTLGQSTQLTWTTSNASACSASGGTSNWSGPQPLNGSNVAVGPFSTAASYSLVLTCTGAGGSTAGTADIVVGSGAPPPGAAVTVSVDPTTVTAGVAAGLTWTSANVSACTASGSWNGSQPLTGTDVSTGILSVPGNYAFTLTCNGALGSVTDTASLTVDAPPATILSFSAAQTSLLAGQGTTLSWTALNAASCTASGGLGTDGWLGALAASGSSKSIGPFPAVGTFVYTLACSGPGGSSGPQSVTIGVAAPTPPASVVALAAVPSTIVAGGSTLLTWTSANATGCAASGGAGHDNWGGAVATSSAGTTVGPITVAGDYTYILQCSGPGGTGSAASVTVAVGAAPAPASITTFAAIPVSLSTGQSLALSWATSNAVSCTASGGTGSDGWSGAQLSASAGTSVGPLNVAGTFVYGLQCTGPGGTSAVSSVTVTVTAPPLPASIIAFTAIPNSIVAGQSISLSWASVGATACAASGGSGGDGWSGTVPASSTNTSVGPITTVGTVIYTLTCSGPGGPSGPISVNLAVTPAPVGPPSITLSANGQNPAQLSPGQTLTLAWSTAHATACTASGGTGSDGWAGPQGTTNAGLSLGAIATPGVYAYTLSCTGPGGSAAASVTVTVISSASADCGIGTPSTALLDPAATVSSAVNGLCLGTCSVNAPANVVDANQTNYATMNVGLGVLAYDSLTVTDSAATFPGGRTVGFEIAEPGQVLSLSVLGNLTIDTLLQGAVRESAGTGSLLRLNAFGNPTNASAAFLGFATHKPFNAVRINVASLATVKTSVRVYTACVTLQ